MSEIEWLKQNHPRLSKMLDEVTNNVLAATRSLQICTVLSAASYSQGKGVGPAALLALILETRISGVMALWRVWDATRVAKQRDGATIHTIMQELADTKFIEARIERARKLPLQYWRSSNSVKPVSPSDQIDTAIAEMRSYADLSWQRSSEVKENFHQIDRLYVSLRGDHRRTLLEDARHRIAHPSRPSLPSRMKAVFLHQEALGFAGDTGKLVANIEIASRSNSILLPTFVESWRRAAERLVQDIRPEAH